MLDNLRTLVIEYGDISDDGHGKTKTVSFKTNLTNEEVNLCNDKCFKVFGKYLWPDYSKNYNRKDVILYEYEDNFLYSDFIEALKDKCPYEFDGYEILQYEEEGKVEVYFDEYETLLSRVISYLAEEFISKNAIFELIDNNPDIISIYGGYALFF